MFGLAAVVDQNGPKSTLVAEFFLFSGLLAMACGAAELGSSTGWDVSPFRSQAQLLSVGGADHVVRIPDWHYRSCGVGALTRAQPTVFLRSIVLMHRHETDRNRTKSG